jgi:sirohydrochlorin ferrochelatase
VSAPHPDKHRALLLVDHGSRVESAHVQLERVADSLKIRLAEVGKPTIVEIAHLEIASPDLEEAAAACVRQGAGEVLIIPCFLAQGRHLSRDIPALVRAAERTHPTVTFRVAPSLYELDAFVDLLMQTAELH